jgi:glycerophosphoryl diester phosphodiesterase
MYPELKHPSYFKSLGFSVEENFISILKNEGYNFTTIKGAFPFPLYVQSFEEASLIKLRRLAGSSILLVQLLNPALEIKWKTSDENNGAPQCAVDITNEGSVEENYRLCSIATYANGIGPEKSVIGNPPYSTGRSMIEAAHKLGLVVHPWTFRRDRDILAKFQGDFDAENEYFYCCLGVDGLFTEHPDRSRVTVDRLLKCKTTSGEALGTTNSTEFYVRNCMIDCTAY